MLDRGGDGQLGILGHTRVHATARYADLTDGPPGSAWERIALSLKEAMNG